MKISRIYAIFLRYFFLFRRSFEKLTEVFYWTFVDVFLWGITAAYFESETQYSIIKLILSGIILWVFVQRTQFEINVNILEELWNKNMINIFVSPITFAEWIAGILSISLFKVVLNFIIGSVLILLVYKTNIIDYGFYLLPMAFVLIINGWVISFFIGALLLKYGTKIQSIGWTIVFLFAPFSGIYYPVDVLPQFAQTVSKFIPMSYIFEIMRQLASNNLFDWNQYFVSLALSFFYLVIGIVLLRLSFKSILNRGLISLQ